jgi:glycosyltransferase involved in cell wall biosynthesis
VLAWACFTRRRRYRTIFTDGEQVGIPLAWLTKFCDLKRHRPRHLMIAHVLSVRKKMVFFDWFGVHSHIDRFFVYSTWQKRFIEDRWKIPPERGVLTPFMVDTQFFAADRVVPTDTPGPPMICSVGLEARDYATLLRAACGLEVRLTIAAGSLWSRRAAPTRNQEIPVNVSVRRVCQTELRQIYADSLFMVMPLHAVDYQAGVTAILEAMAMSRAVICSRTPGQTDVIVEGETGMYVPPNDPAALRAAIRYLLEHPDEAARMGRAGRQRVEQSMSLECYAAGLSRWVTDGIAAHRTRCAR